MTIALEILETVAERCGAMASCYWLLCSNPSAFCIGEPWCSEWHCCAMREKSKNAVRLGGVSKLVAQFSGAVCGLSTEGTVQWQCNPGENSVTLGGVSVSVGFAFSGGTPSRRWTRIIFSGCRLLWCILNFV